MERCIEIVPATIAFRKGLKLAPSVARPSGVWSILTTKFGRQLILAFILGKYVQLTRPSQGKCMRRDNHSGGKNESGSVKYDSISGFNARDAHP